jgi:hypothetical protein
MRFCSVESFGRASYCCCEGPSLIKITLVYIITAYFSYIFIILVCLLCPDLLSWLFYEVFSQNFVCSFPVCVLYASTLSTSLTESQ